MKRQSAIESLSHQVCDESHPDVSSHKRLDTKLKDKHVRFESCTTDIITTLFERSEFRFYSDKKRRVEHCRPVLKYTQEMTEYLRRAGSSFARALTALGTYCSGVTSDNPNVRSDMYRQLVAQIRGVSPHMRQAGESVLCSNVHGMWLQLVEDFSMQREEYTPENVVLYENAAQVIGITLTNHRFLEKLDVLDVQSLVMEILNRVEHHIETKAPLDNRFQSHIWLLGCEVSGWWENQSIFYSEGLCQRLYEIVARVDIWGATAPIQRAILEIFRIVFSRYPNLKGLAAEKFLSTAWDFTWNEDEQVKRAARAVVNLIADHRGGELNTFKVIKLKYRVPELLQYELCTKIKDEIRVFPIDGLAFWLTITRLVKENIISLAQDRLKIWLQIPQEKLSYHPSNRMAGIMFAYLTHYCESRIEKTTKMYDLFAAPFQQRTTNVRTPLKALDNCLNAFYYNSPLQEPLPSDRPRQRPNLKVWARMTVDALDFRHTLLLNKVLVKKEAREETDILVARIFCHWDNLIRALVEIKSFEDYDEDQKTQDIIDICNIFGPIFSEYIQNPYNILLKHGKHAVHVFWFNLMALTISRDQVINQQVFPVEILRSLLPMIIAGCQSTQLRIRQSTYRFLVARNILGGMRWLVEKDAIKLTEAVDFAREEFEADSYDIYGNDVIQVSDYGTMMTECFVENGVVHPTTLKPLVRTDGGDVKWVWFDPDGKEFGLGKEEVFTEGETLKVEEILAARAEREKIRLAKKEKDKKERREKRELKKMKEAAKQDTVVENSTISTSTQQLKQVAPIEVDQALREISPNMSPKSPTRSDRERLSQLNAALPVKESSPVSEINTNPGSTVQQPIQPSPPKPQTSQSVSVISYTSQASASPQKPVTYDKRMPPPPVNWRPSTKSSPTKSSPTQSQPVESSPTKSNVSQSNNLKKSTDAVSTSETESMDNVINALVQDAQKPDAPVAKGSIITGKRNQLDSVQIIGDKHDTEEWRTMNSYLREGDDRIGILPSGWKEAHCTPATEQSPESSTSNTSGRKRTWEGTELPKDDDVSKRRKLKSDYCPATHTTWKPAWLETTQCYPVDQMGEDMSDIEVLRGDAVHRNAEKLKRILEMECMYIPTHRVDELVNIAEETVKSLKRTREYYEAEPTKKIRIERHEFR